MRILIIEDELGIASFIAEGLSEEGYLVDISDKGDQGLAMALQNQYDLLLIDWMLPNLSGIEICEKIRTKDKKTPIIFLTAKDTLQDTVKGLHVGANDYVKKPFYFEELLERIKVQFRPLMDSSANLQLGDIHINIKSHQVFKTNEEVALTQKEFQLLEYLIRNKGGVCERKKIIEDVWDIHFEYDTGIIDVYINALRNKLQLTKGKGYIETVRGIGYIARI